MINWKEDAVVKRFLLAVWAIHGSDKLDHKEIARLMGNGCTAKAVSHRIADFKKMRDALRDGTYDDEPGEGSATADPDKASRKRKSAVKGETSIAKKLKVSKASNVDGALKTDSDEDKGAKIERI